MRPVWWTAGSALALAAVALGVYGWTLDLPLLGWDAYPLIAASRIDSLTSFCGTFTEELMDGRYGDGRFHRPLTHLSFALDHALYGLDPRGYRATDLALLFGAAWAVGRVARRFMTGWAANVAALVAGLVYLLHPAQLEVLPYAPRRADSLAVFGTCLTLALHGRARPALVGLAAFCAAGAKETGYLVLPLAGAFVLLLGGHWRSLMPVGLGVGAVAALRMLAIGGIGGHAESGAAAADSAVTVAADLARGLAGGSSPSLAALLALPFVAAFAQLARVHARAAAWLAASAAAAALMTLAAGRAHGWYVALLTLPLAWIAGLTIARAVERRGAFERVVAFGMVAALASTLPATLAARHDLGFERAANLARAPESVLTEDAARVRAAGGGDSFIDTWSYGVPRRGGFVFVHAPYSLCALAECLNPELTPAVTPECPPWPAGQILAARPPGTWRLLLSESMR